MKLAALLLVQVGYGKNSNELTGALAEEKKIYNHKEDLWL